MITEEQQLEKMRRKILKDSSNSSLDEDFKDCLEDAKFRYLRLVYPYRYRKMTELPDESAKNWQTKCAIELYKLDGNENTISYAENGLSETYARAGISQDLLNELPSPEAGVPS